MSVRHVNPEGMPRSPAFSQAVVVEAPAKTIYVGGQNGVGADGKVVGDTVGEQARQAFRNLASVLAAEGATLADIVRWSIAVVDGHSVYEGFGAFQEVWDPSDLPPAITVHVVAGLPAPSSWSRSTPSPPSEDPSEPSRPSGPAMPSPATEGADPAGTATPTGLTKDVGWEIGVSRSFPCTSDRLDALTPLLEAHPGGGPGPRPHVRSATHRRLRAGPRPLGTYTAGGTVVTTGCTDWVHGLSGRSPAVEKITATILGRLG